MRHFAWVVVAAVAGCGRSALPTPGGAVESREPDRPTPLPACPEGASCDDGKACTVDDRCVGNRCEGDPSADCGPIVQEWGTYTSVQASDGHALGGVHHEDEALPFWVYRRDFYRSEGYYLEKLEEEPLQQLETPVFYFWSPVAKSVRVEVGFPQGVVGEWFPDAATFAPKLYEMTSLSGGSMVWDVRVDPSISPASFKAVDPDEIWAPSRRVKSTPVRRDITDESGQRVATESEQFVFYRGLGTFEPPVHVVSGDAALDINNESGDEVPVAFLLRFTGGRGKIVALGPLPAHGSLAAAVPVALESHETFLAEARRLLAEELVGSGLRGDVAQAMVDTWTRSWFGNEGLRVLYLAPRTWTDAWLPTTITPAPAAFVRTLVGRIEVLTPAEEAAVVDTLRKARQTGTSVDFASLGRFAEPRLRRALELAVDPADVAFTQNAVDVAHTRR